jgi:DNA-binding transcriptional regulator GbsR (MarR family)
MSLNNYPKGLISLANSVGDFIRYWGFRRIHGQIWVMVYLSKVPVSGVDLVKALKVSKSLISPALKELEDYGLIEQIISENSKTKRYIAKPDVFEIIKDVLINREMQILNSVQSHHNLVTKVSAATELPDLDQERLKELGDMIQSANSFISAIVKINSPESLRFLAKWLSRKP